MKLGRNLKLLILLIIVFLLPILLRNNNYFLIVLILCCINVILASSLRAIASVGQICMGIMAFMGIGAYTSAILMKKFGFAIWAAFPLAGISALIVGLIVAFPFVRVMGIYFAMLTLFLGEVIRLAITEWRGMTGGTVGMLGIPSIGKFSILGLDINFVMLLPYCYFVFFIMLVILFILYRIDRSHIGVTLAAIEQDESVASSVGINVIKYKVLMFCVGCFFAGLAGSLQAHYMRVLNPDSFGLFPSIYILIYMVVGGRKRFAGPIIGAVVLTLVPEVFRPLKAYNPLVLVGVLFFVLYFMREGLVDLPGKVKGLLRRFNIQRVGDV